MATPITYNKVADWVNYTELGNVPASVRIISAEDIFRWENSHEALTSRSNEHDSLLTNAGNSVTQLQQQVAQLSGTIATQNTVISQLAGTVGTLTSQLNASLRPTLIRALATAYQMVVGNRIHIHTGGSATYTLPEISTSPAGTDFLVFNKGTGTLTVASASGAQIYFTTASSTTYPVGSQQSAMFVSDGSVWVVVMTDSNTTV